MNKINKNEQNEFSEKIEQKKTRRIKTPKTHSGLLWVEKSKLKANAYISNKFHFF